MTTEPMLQFFAYEHLPPELRGISMEFFDMASRLVQKLPRNPERTVALRKLLEAKDCAVRAKLFVDLDSIDPEREKRAVKAEKGAGVIAATACPHGVPFPNRCMQCGYGNTI